MFIGILIGAGIALLVTALFFAADKRRHTRQSDIFEQKAQQALGSMMQEVIKATREQLGAEKRDISESIAKDLQTQSDSFRTLTESLRQEITERQREIRKMEEDRNLKYGQIAQALTDYKLLTEELRSSTEDLKRVLANNQLRGSWGEMQAEKVLQAAGMTEGYHYVKQQPMAHAPELRPDFTLLLPNKLQLYVDVKFPLQALQQAMATENKGEVERHLQQFGLDVKARIKEVSKYITPHVSSVDYALLFVPSESVFEIINKSFPAIIDTSFSQQVILVSPHSFFAVVRTIQESYTHFYYEQNLTEILTYLQDMLRHFERFKGEFADVGKALESARAKYDHVATTRYRQIDKLSEKMQRLDVQRDPTAPVLTEYVAASETIVE